MGIQSVMPRQGQTAHAAPLAAFPTGLGREDIARKSEVSMPPIYFSGTQLGTVFPAFFFVPIRS